MNIILLSGGSGQRLWPLSNYIRSKQFIKLLKREDGVYESMLQRIYRQIISVDKQANITITTSKTQVSVIKNQLEQKVSICVEPARRDTFPAILLACAYLSSVKGLDEEEPVLVCPVDPYVNDDYFEALKLVEEAVKKGTGNLTLLGVEPTYPSEKYGYIIPEVFGQCSKVKEFKEKPDCRAAEHYIKQGALWNCGVFGFKLGHLLRIAHEIIDFQDYYDLYKNYENLEKTSFDYAVVEKESSIQVIRFQGEWKDIGTWNTFTEQMAEQIIGEALLDEACERTNVINELNIPIICMGVKDTVIVASNDGILVSDKKQSSFIKPYVERLSCQIHYAEKSWGSFTLLDVTERSMTIKIHLKSGHKMNYHSHEERREVWNIVSGLGKVIVDNKIWEVNAGEVVELPIGCKHTIMAESELIIIEVQSGEDICVEDKIKYDFPIF